MKLNGWQRIYSILVLSWVTYLAITAYSNLSFHENRIVELTAAIERLEHQPAATSTAAGSIIGIGADQWAEHYQARLAETEQSKVSTIIAAVFLGTVPPVLIYLIIVWVSAGFRQQARVNN